jgi:molybdopterin molybdotransferase
MGVQKARRLDSAGKVLRTPIKADRELPPFDRSAMDGYAARVSDFVGGKAFLKCVGSLEAGNLWKGTLKKRETVKIMTGAPVPDGADVVVKVEQSKSKNGMTMLDEPKITKWGNIHRMGADARRGETLVRGGEVLKPLHLSVAASVGMETLSVSRRVRACVISTGTEQAAVGAKPKPFQIRDSNSAYLLARLSSTGLADASFGGAIRDEPKALEKAMRNALEENDMVIVSGGVSMGDSDFTGATLERLGVKKVFHKCAIRPGKPVWFGLNKDAVAFGLPGNPVSIAVTFQEFVLPALRKMAGANVVMPRKLFLPLETAVRKGNSLREFRVARLTEKGTVEAFKGYGGSGDLVSASKSDGVIVLPEEIRELKAGTVVEFHPWEF